MNADGKATAEADGDAEADTDPDALLDSTTATLDVSSAAAVCCVISFSPHTLVKEAAAFRGHLCAKKSTLRMNHTCS